MRQTDGAGEARAGGVKVNVEQPQVVDVGAFHPAQPGVLQNLSDAQSVFNSTDVYKYTPCMPPVQCSYCIATTSPVCHIHATQGSKSRRKNYFIETWLRSAA
jgi:hypothetical protein